MKGLKSPQSDYMCWVMLTCTHCHSLSFTFSGRLGEGLTALKVGDNILGPKDELKEKVVFKIISNLDQLLRAGLIVGVSIHTPQGPHFDGRAPPCFVQPGALCNVNRPVGVLTDCYAAAVLCIYRHERQ